MIQVLSVAKSQCVIVSKFYQIWRALQLWKPIASLIEM